MDQGNVSVHTGYRNTQVRNTTQVIIRHRICLQTDGHGETSIPPYNFVAGGIKTNTVELVQSDT
jgi:hypothetical protein